MNNELTSRKKLLKRSLFTRELTGGSFVFFSFDAIAIGDKRFELFILSTTIENEL